jgi:hypothetical protein
MLSVSMPDGRVLRFSQSFYVGRGEECDLRIDDRLVSRRHLLVALANGQWEVQDLHSSNGVFANGERIESAPVVGQLDISLGRQGPVLTLELEQPGSRRAPAQTQFEQYEDEDSGAADPSQDDGGVDDYAKRYFGADDDGAAGPRTVMIRRAFREVQQKQKRRYGGVLAVLGVAALVAIGLAYRGYLEVQRQRAEMEQQRALAEDLFYSMKEIDVSIANLEQQVSTAGDAAGLAAVRKYRSNRQEMERTYDQYVAKYYSRNLNEAERLVLRVTRLFGECELAAPPEYLEEVLSYVKKWQSTGRFARALNVAQSKGYIRHIANEFIAQNLPPQFFYLAMQESDFDAFITGPPTSWGFAKGMWQFIPETGKRYNLKIGPLYQKPVPDVEDDRHKWDRATTAAARYIKDIYRTDAQASGLLVMASYNWGEGRVIKMVRSLTPNPKERNFWKLQERYRRNIPGETYNYVLHIVAAAVIGENPRAFGFAFDNPLAFVDAEQAAAP